MQAGKLIQLLKTLNKKEFKEFQLFVGSEFYNKNQNLIKFLEFLSAYQGDFESDKLEKEVFFKKHYKGEEFEEQKFRYLQSDLTKLLEEFITLQEFQKDTYQKKFFLQKRLHQRNQDKKYLQEL